MLSKLARRMTWANVAMTLALVFAMTGGAYAAKKYLITNTKQISPKVLKALAGKAGAQGPAGPAGAVGPQGPAGANGKDGASGGSGKDGVSVTSSTASAGECPTGGVKYTSASGTNAVCNGKDGQTGFTKTLPAEETETGTWSVTYNASAPQDAGSADISFPIPLASPIENGHVVEIGVLEGEGEENENKTDIPSKCMGNVTKPEAVPGYLCVFTKLSINAETLAALGARFANPEGGGETAGKTGAAMLVGAKGAGLVLAYGDWAVTPIE